MTLRWGILSTARINDKFLAGCAASDELKVVAVASREGERARAYAAEHGIDRAHDGYDALLADPEVDAIYIPLPNALHLEWTERALRAGKHVLCEKPMGRRAAAVAAAFDLAEQQGLILCEAFMFRHHPQTLRVAELVAAGAIGPLRLIRASFSFPLTDPGDVRLATALDGGSLMDLGCYCVSGARMLGGEPERVTGQQVLGGDGVDVAFVGTMVFSGGVTAHFDAGFCSAVRSELEVTGEHGSLRVADPWHCRNSGIELCTEAGAEQIPVPRADPYRLEAEDMAAAIRGEREPRLGRADALGQAAAIEALYASAAAGGTPVSRHG
ncbi:MAG TPA: Gfo/Idh/MocA family oxidoreductase [Solirubrobacteraceae bacterium]|nr:Gfo/Idh/MocA family oxidoreductase [Solirubrobacteraceae bacterium]